MVRKRVAGLFSRLTPSSERVLSNLLRSERSGGLLLLFGAAMALVWANSPWASGYEDLRQFVPLDWAPMLPGGQVLHLDLTLAEWATDGALAVFFFVVGLELKREFIEGELRRPSSAVVPIVAAVGGMVVPALIFVAINATAATGDVSGWAIPTATDIAFALTILAVVGRRLPSALRAFLLTLAVVDDLIAIVIIAVFYSAGLHLEWLLVAGVVVALIWYLMRRRAVGVAVLVPLAALTWLCVHQSGVHATIAGVVIALVVPARRLPGEKVSPVERSEHRWSPISAGIAVPVFAFFAAGVALDGEALAAAVQDPVSQGVVLGLVVGKPVGILLATFLVAKLTRAQLGAGLSWWDVGGVAIVGGVGFTVSLLLGELAFGQGTDRDAHIKAAILIASTLAALGGAAILAWRDRHYARIAREA